MGAPTACRRMVSGSFSLLCSRCFSPFPHGTGPLSVRQVYSGLPNGLGGFTRDSTRPALLGTRLPPDHARSATGPSPSTARYPTRFASHTVLSLAAGASAPARPLPRHQCRNPRRVSHGTGLAIIRFRSPLLTEYPFLQVLRCFTSLRTPRTKLCGAGPQQPAGYPIRTPSDQSPVGGSPRPIAAPHVLHRYCLPRHPPYAHGNKPTNPAKRGHGPMPLALEHPTTTNQII